MFEFKIFTFIHFRYNSLTINLLDRKNAYNKELSCRPCEHSSIDRDMYYYMQGSEFEPQTSDLFTLKRQTLATRLLEK